VLKDYQIQAKPVFIAYPSRRHLTPRTRVVINFLVEQNEGFGFVGVDLAGGVGSVLVYRNIQN
jgi:hypothetical protein